MKKRVLFFSIAAAFIIGCGENSSVSDANINYEQQNIFSAIPVNVTYTNYTVKVADDDIVGANVVAPECNSSKELGDGKYLLQNCVAKPHYIIAQNGKIKDTNITQTFPLILNTDLTDKDDNFVISPLTTIVADANETYIEDLANKLGISKYEFFEDPSNNNEVLDKARKINAIMLAAMTNGVVSNKLEFIKILRDTINENPDLNVTEISQEITKKSQSNPGLFGLVFINNLPNNDNILDEIQKLQHPNKVKFLGLVFDKQISDANITIKWADTNDTFLDGIVSGSDGNFTIELDDEHLAELNSSQDKILLFEAKKDHIVLTSTISVKDVLNTLNSTKVVNPSLQPNLVISNITTVETAILANKNALNNLSSYESNVSEIKTYYNDKILKAAAVVKDIVDNNNISLLTDTDNTFDFVKQNIIVSSNEVNLSNDIENIDTTQLEENITQNAILNAQLNYIPQVNTTNINGFENAANSAGNVFYRILAYCPSDENCNESTIIREYDKIVTLPGFYQITKCTLEGNTTSDWNCNEPIEIYNANFSNGKYMATDSNNVVISYGLDSNDSIFISALCKSYNIYDVTKQTIVANEVNNSVPEVLVDSYDVVDMFRRMPNTQPDNFKDLIDTVNENGHTREKVNYALNRYIRNSIKDIKDYFSDSNTSTQCENQ